MMLLGQMLQQAGLAFINAKAVHRRDGSLEGLITCETLEEAQAVNRWAADRELAIIARLATPEEIAEHKKWQELY